MDGGLTGGQVKALAAKEDIMRQEIALIGKALTTGMGRQCGKKLHHALCKAGIVLGIAFQEGIALQKVRTAPQQCSVKMESMQLQAETGGSHANPLRKIAGKDS